MVSEEELGGSEEEEGEDRTRGRGKEGSGRGGSGPLEAVSDEELPAPPTAEHVPDAEAISEDELPRAEQTSPLSDGSVAGEEQDDVGRRGSDAVEMEMTGGTEEREVVPEEGKVNTGVVKEKKKRKSKKGGGPSAKKATVDQNKPQSELKSLPELEKYWKAVKDDSTDFTGWTYLLQYVDQENDVEAAREAYDAFLSHYPYCYGYWRKYADYERRKGDKAKCEEVFERGLKAIPLSVDLWIHYINYCKTVYKSDEEHMRHQFQRAIEVCGIEFRSDRLWESYIKWEVENKNLQQAMAVYERLLQTPLQTYTTHFENFEEFVRNHQPNKILGVDEFLNLRQEVLQEIKQKSKTTVSALGTSSAPPGDEEEEEGEKSPKSADEETKMVREKIINLRKEVFKMTVSAVSARWNYEEGIKRPYFHVKPLEKYQLNNWMNYLDFEIEGGDEKRTMILFERCLIACALYDEFWFKYIRYLESLAGDRTDRIRDVYQRACIIHHPNKPFLALNWAIFEEVQENIDGAREALERIDSAVPGLMKVATRRINLERRIGNIDEVIILYEQYMAAAKSKSVATALAVKYARFCWKILEDPNRGIEVLKRAAENDRDNPRIELQMLDLTLAKPGIQEEEFLSIVDKLIENPSIEPEFKLSFAQRKVEFLEDFGKDVSRSMKASHEYMNILKMCKDRKRKRMEPDKKQEESSKKSKEVNSNHQVAKTASSTSQVNSSGYGQTGSYPTSGQTGYQGSSSYPQQSYGQSSYNQTDQNYNNYQGWGYSQGYGNYNQAWSGYNYYSS